MIDREIPKPPATDERELRLALVCYGGVSLAIYMHGITKEIHRLVRASEALNAGKTPEAGTETTYARALARRSAIDVPTHRLDDLVEVVEVGQQLTDEKGVMRAKAPGQGLAQRRELFRRVPRARSAKTSGS